jgi:hypothetical protein
MDGVGIITTIVTGLAILGGICGIVNRSEDRIRRAMEERFRRMNLRRDGMGELWRAEFGRLAAK